MADRTCSICSGKHYGRGFCRTHWRRWYRHGDPEYTEGDCRFKPHPDIEERFLVTVDRSGGLDACWPRNACEDKNGYTHFSVSHDEPVPAHRWAYERFVGPIPPGHVIDHVVARGCGGGNCVNWIRHLEPVTTRENQLRGKNTKLSDESALALYQRWLSGETQRALASEIPMAQASLSIRFKIISQSLLQTGIYQDETRPPASGNPMSPLPL
jgi:hypothetical protein